MQWCFSKHTGYAIISKSKLNVQKVKSQCRHVFVIQWDVMQYKNKLFFWGCSETVCTQAKSVIVVFLRRSGVCNGLSGVLGILNIYTMLLKCPTYFCKSVLLHGTIKLHKNAPRDKCHS